MFGTLLSATLALLIAAPLAVCIALFITHCAPRRLAQGLGYLVDLLAAVPSIIIGLWGLAVLSPLTVPPTDWLADNLDSIPLFAGQASNIGRTMLVAALVLAVMVLPIITALSPRGVFCRHRRCTRRRRWRWGRPACEAVD